MRRGWAVTVFEAGPHVGGMARSFDLWGVRVDLGPHRFFSRDERVNAFWHDLAGEDFAWVDRLTRIRYGDRFFAYPLRPGDALRNLGWADAVRCAASYAGAKIRQAWHRDPPSNFEEWVVEAFGRRLFERFFRDYSEKLWGLPCRELDTDFAAQRIQRLSLGRAVWAALGGERGRHKTLVQRFPHPLEGAGMIYERLAARIRAGGGDIRLGTPVQGLAPDGRGVRLRDGAVHEADAVVSTMPLTLLCASLPELPAELAENVRRLTYRNTILVYLHVDHPELFPDQWVYVQTPDLKLGRVTNFRNWPGGRRDDRATSVLALEYWCDDTDALWTGPDGPLVELASAELARSGLGRGAAVLEGKVVRLPRCYPVYRRGYRAWLEPLARHLRSAHPDLLAIGRYGAFKYNNQDHSILMGLLAAENLADGAGHDLWAINTDYGVYQEGGTVPEGPDRHS
jgi:protoporphyrinogen oxidase